jgi:hypothetical protein
MPWVLVAAVDAVDRASWTVFAVERTGIAVKLFGAFQRLHSLMHEPPPEKAAP